MAENTRTDATIGGRIEKFYVDKGLTRRQFAEILKLSYDKITSYVTEKAEPGTDFWIALLSEYPEADLVYLMSGKNSQPKPEIEIPILEEITAGQLAVFLDSKIIGKTTTLNSSDPGLFALKVKGDSMHPEIEEGDVAICAPNRPFVSGRIYAVQCDTGGTTIKRVFKRGDGYDLVPTNSEYDVAHIHANQMCRLVRVVEIQRKLL